MMLARKPARLPTSPPAIAPDICSQRTLVIRVLFIRGRCDLTLGRQQCESPIQGIGATALLRQGCIMTPIKLGRLSRHAWTCALVCLTLASCSEGPLDPQGPIGKAERLILLDATAIMLAVGIPVILLTFCFAWWFRSGNSRARHRPEWEYSGRIEMIVWSIPALVVLFLGGIAWIGSHDLDPPAALKSSAAPVEVQVVSVDWRWVF